MLQAPDKALVFFALLALTFANVSANLSSQPMKTEIKAEPKLYNSIENYVVSVLKEFDQIPQERKEALEELSLYIRNKIKASAPVKLTFICTYNSRRSHISQIWAQTAAYFYGMAGIESYSGGTEATAFNPRAVKAMAKAGFRIDKTNEDNNPVYQVKFAEKAAPVKAYSKVYDAVENPQESFAAVMTCSHSDETCPFIPGADARIAIAYNDPKEFDGTPQEEAKYEERVRQIAREILYVFSQVK